MRGVILLVEKARRKGRRMIMTKIKMQKMEEKVHVPAM